MNKKNSRMQREVGAGIVAAGHDATAEAAAEILASGGNAFDAIIAAQFAACVAEPVLCSLGGGGFLLARAATGPVRCFDFFVQTPRRKRPPGEIDFHPILADFGDAQQEFHIGLGSVATPGTVRGLYAVHRALASLPMARLLEPAIRLARDGVRVNAMQAHAFGIVKAIYTRSSESRDLFASPDRPGQLVGAGDLLRQPELGDVLDELSRKGEAWFHEGEFAALVDELCRREGGFLRREDLREYRALERSPLEADYRGARVWSNPPPSSGGLLIAFALKLLEAAPPPEDFGAPAHLGLLARAMDLTNRARVESRLTDATHPDGEALLEPAYLELYRAMVLGRPASRRGTTHMSVIDGWGNMASLTASNGEGCGVMIPDTGIMLNNMLGEEDLNPDGFHRWTENRRMTSMMAPTLVETHTGRCFALGSGGSNRIRTAILQVLVNLLDLGMPLEEAVAAPRIHLEQDLLSLEAGHDDRAVAELLQAYPRYQHFRGLSLFFGGVHAVSLGPGGMAGAGDPRRGGVVRNVRMPVPGTTPAIRR